MPSAAHLRHQIQTALAHKAPSALTPAVRLVQPGVPTGVQVVDQLLEGGFPAGTISELTGPNCSGRISLAMAFVAGQTHKRQVCAWVDASDEFDPASALASGVDLERLLWVRCGQNTPSTQAKQAVSSGSRFAVLPPPPSNKTSLGMHPRAEARGLSTAIQGMLGGRNEGKPGTPGASNRPLTAPEPQARPTRTEQIATDRLPARRGEHALDQKARMAAGETGLVHSLAAHATELAHAAPRCAETQQGFARSSQAKVQLLPSPATPPAPPENTSRLSPWDKLDQAIRTTDLLLQGAGFCCIVLDLSGIEAEFAGRIPLATWFRFRAAADRTRSILLVLTRHPCTGSSGEVLLKMTAEVPEATTVMTRIPFHLERMRQRLTMPRELEPTNRTGNLVTMRKPPQSVRSADWIAPSASLKKTSAFLKKIGAAG